jgi:hypothetical protein
MPKLSTGTSYLSKTHNARKWLICRPIGIKCLLLVSTQFSTPVLFLIINRPELTAKVFAAVRESKPASLNAQVQKSLK